MTTAQICILTAIVLYLLLMLAVGFVCSKKNKNTDDFYLGGRRLGPIVTAMSAEASDMSGWLLMGLPGVAYLTGIADAGWTAIGLAIGTYLNWLFVAKRISCYSKVTNSITIPGFFSKRFHDNKKILMFAAAVIIIVFFIPYTASGFSACGKLFSSLFGINYVTAMVISAVVIVGYTVLGGFLAASTTDLIQSIVMTIALIVVLGFGIYQAGGINAVMDNAQSLSGYLSMRMTHDAVSGTGGSYSTITIISTLAWGLGYFGMPHILLRFMAIENKKKLKLSRRVATTWVVISLAIAVLIGVVGIAMTNAGAIESLKDSETIIISIAALLSKFGILPALVAGVILAGILASTMSTADSQLLAASSSVSQNIITEIFNVKLSRKATMIIARITLVLLALISMLIARNPNASVFKIVSFAWAGFGAAFGPVILFSLFWKRTNVWGAFSGILSGGIMVFVWKFLVRPIGGVWDIYELLPAFIIASIMIVAVSLLTPAPDKKIIDEFNQAKSMSKE